jgi:hypothetical protein
LRHLRHLNLKVLWVHSTGRRWLGKSGLSVRLQVRVDGVVQFRGKKKEMNPKWTKMLLLLLLWSDENGVSFAVGAVPPADLCSELQLGGLSTATSQNFDDYRRQASKLCLHAKNYYYINCIFIIILYIWPINILAKPTDLCLTDHRFKFGTTVPMYVHTCIKVI